MFLSVKRQWTALVYCMVYVWFEEATLLKINEIEKAQPLRIVA